MKNTIQLVLFLLVITSGICFSQSLKHSINSCYNTWTGKSISMDYVIGEPIAPLSNTLFSTTSIPLATLSDSAVGIYTVNNVNFCIYPNPASSHIAFSIAQEGHYTISLFDIASNKVADLHSDWLEANAEVVLSIEHLYISSGTYFVLISNANQNINQNAIFLGTQSNILNNDAKQFNVMAKIIILK